MALQTALDFIDRVRRDSAFRKAGYAASLDHKFTAWLKESGFNFNQSEIWDAFRSMLLKCKDEEAADEVKELRVWYMLLAGESEESGGSCGSCAKKGSCGGSCA